MPETITIHVLKHGLPLCGFSNKVPAEWRKDQKWVATKEELLNLWYPGGVACNGCASHNESKPTP